MVIKRNTQTRNPLQHRLGNPPCKMRSRRKDVEKGRGTATRVYPPAGTSTHGNCLSTISAAKQNSKCSHSKEMRLQWSVPTANTSRCGRLQRLVLVIRLQVGVDTRIDLIKHLTKTSKRLQHIPHFLSSVYIHSRGTWGNVNLWEASTRLSPE